MQEIQTTATKPKRTVNNIMLEAKNILSIAKLRAKGQLPPILSTLGWKLGEFYSKEEVISLIKQLPGAITALENTEEPLAGFNKGDQETLLKRLKSIHKWLTNNKERLFLSLEAAAYKRLKEKQGDTATPLIAAQELIAYRERQYERKTRRNQSAHYEIKLPSPMR